MKSAIIEAGEGHHDHYEDSRNEADTLEGSYGRQGNGVKKKKYRARKRKKQRVFSTSSLRK